MNFGVVIVLILEGGLQGFMISPIGWLFLGLGCFLLITVILILNNKAHHPLVSYGIPVAIILLIVNEIHTGPTINLITFLFLGIGKMMDARSIHEP